MGRILHYGYRYPQNIESKVSVSNFINIEIINIFKGFDPFEFLKLETRWDCRSYRIYGVRCHAA